MNISLNQAKQNKLFYVVTNGIIYHPQKKKCLILQRSFKEKAHPGLWGVVGGKMEWSDMENNQPTRQNHDIPDWEGLVEQSLIREAREESGLETEDPRYLCSIVFLRPDNVPVVLLKFALKWKSGEIKIPDEFEDFAWVDSEEVKKYEIIQGIDKEVIKTMEIYIGEN